MSEYITVKEFATKTGYTHAHILNMINNGDIKDYLRPTPRKTKIHKKELKRFGF